MDDDIRAAVVAGTAAGRLGTPEDVANLVRFLFSERGGWVDGQLLMSNGGFPKQ
jgi:3-oxoacyl-[acyl-carrier protein] reductase